MQIKSTIPLCADNPTYFSRLHQRFFLSFFHILLLFCRSLHAKFFEKLAFSFYSSFYQCIFFSLKSNTRRCHFRNRLLIQFRGYQKETQILSSPPLIYSSFTLFFSFSHRQSLVHTLACCFVRAFFYLFLSMHFCTSVMLGGKKGNTEKVAKPGGETLCTIQIKKNYPTNKIPTFLSLHVYFYSSVFPLTFAYVSLQSLSLHKFLFLYAHDAYDSISSNDIA